MKQSRNLKTMDRRFDERKMCFFTEVDYSINNKVYTDSIKNISSGGVFIETQAPLSVGADVTMLFSDYSNIDLIKVEGDVVRRMPTGVAVKFDMDQSMKVREMNNFIEKV